MSRTVVRLMFGIPAFPLVYGWCQLRQNMTTRIPIPEDALSPESWSMLVKNCWKRGERERTKRREQV